MEARGRERVTHRLDVEALQVESYTIPGFGKCQVCGDAGEVDDEGVCVFCQPCPDCGRFGDCPLEGCGAQLDEEAA